MAVSADCLVLGAGVVGVSTALKLQEAGRDVILIDRQPAGEATSYGNAGIIQAEGVVPYMLPRNVALIAKMAANRRPEAHLHYRALGPLAPWLIRYWWNSSERRTEAGARAHLPLVERCIEEHEPLIEAAGISGLLRRTGYLRAFRDTADLETDERILKDQAERYGVNFETCNPDKLADLEPHMSNEIVGATYLPDPVSVSDPSAVVKAYADLFKARGGRFLTADAQTLTKSDGRWQVSSVDGPISAEHAILALGPWSADILKAVGVSVPLAPKRGYHMHYGAHGNATLNRPVLDADNGYVLAPMAKGIRLTTGAEFAFRDAPPTPKQLDLVEPAARELFPLANRLDSSPWMGVRPCLPDMVPAIGPVPRNKGLWVNFGHHHLGLTLGAVTGRLLTEMIVGSEVFTDPKPYSIERF